MRIGELSAERRGRAVGALGRCPVLTCSSTAQMKLCSRRISTAPARAAGKVLGVTPVGDNAGARLAAVARWVSETGRAAVRGALTNTVLPGTTTTGAPPAAVRWRDSRSTTPIRVGAPPRCVEGCQPPSLNHTMITSMGNDPDSNGPVAGRPPGSLVTTPPHRSKARMSRCVIPLNASPPSASTVDGVRLLGARQCHQPIRPGRPSVDVTLDGTGGWRRQDGRFGTPGCGANGPTIASAFSGSAAGGTGRARSGMALRLLRAGHRVRYRPARFVSPRRSSGCASAPRIRPVPSALTPVRQARRRPGSAFLHVPVVCRL